MKQKKHYTKLIILIKVNLTNHLVCYIIRDKIIFYKFMRIKGKVIVANAMFWNNLELFVYYALILGLTDLKRLYINSKNKDKVVFHVIFNW